MKHFSDAPLAPAPVEEGELEGEHGADLLGAGGEAPCVADEGAFSAIHAEQPGAVGSVVRVEWEASDTPRSWVRYTDSLGQQRDVPADASGGATLRGLLPETEVDYRVVAEIDGGLVCSDLRTATTTALPVGLPELARTVGEPGDVTPAFLAMPVLTAERRFAVVVDTLGQIVWAWELPRDVAARSAAYRVDFSLDGESILVNAMAAPGDPGAIWRVPWDGVDIDEMRFDNLHRDFVELPDGTLAFLGWESRRLDDGSLLRGDVLFEMAPDGELDVAWNIWEDYDHGLGPTEVLPEVDTPGVVEWAHANGVNWDADTDAWLLSLPELGSHEEGAPPPGSLLSVDRQTATTNWELSHSRGDFDWDGGDFLLEASHSVQLTDQGVLTFNRGSADSCSRATEIALDPSAGEAEIIWESRSEDCIHVVFLGDAKRLPDGDTVVMYSSAGQLDIVDRQGVTRWSLQTDLGAGFGFVDYRTRLYGAPVED